MSDEELPARQPRPGLAGMLDAESFSLQDAMGGWRGFIEAALPGLVFVVTYIIWPGFKVPVIASVATVVIMVIARLIARTPATQAFSGVVGVGLGAIWAWRAGDAGEYFVPGFWINAAWCVGVLLTMLVRWPLVGVVMALLRGTGQGWRADRSAMVRMQLGTGLLAAMFALRLVVQVPLYLAGEVAALGTAKLAMGLPLTALTLWAIWYLVRNAAPRPAPADPHPPTR